MFDFSLWNFKMNRVFLGQNSLIIIILAKWNYCASKIFKNFFLYEIGILGEERHFVSLQVFCCVDRFLKKYICYTYKKNEKEKYVVIIFLCIFIPK